MRRARVAGRGVQGASTLVELLAVIVILSILAYFLITNVSAARDTVEQQQTKARLAQIAALISEYADPASGRRKAQLSRISDLRLTTWDDHFRIVDDFLDELGRGTQA